MNIWNKILEEIQAGKVLALLCVFESIGSSPGRQGFKMYITSDHKLEGSVGGGIMEHKFIEMAKSLLKNGAFEPILKRQIHRKDNGKEQSGMICSGEQTIGLYYFDESSLSFLKEITLKSEEETYIFFDQNGYGLKKENEEMEPFFEKTSITQWKYIEPVDHRPRIHIIGGGHVGLALSKVMNSLGFHVSIYDERKDLNTYNENSCAHQKHIVDFQNINGLIPEDENSYVVLMSFGYRTDKLCIQQLLNRNFKYFGVMGSQSKMDNLLQSLIKEGYDKNLLDQIHTPIGVPINSQTPMEIAISVAAEIIGVKNGKFLDN